jgi:hypothetical protein
MWMRCCTSRRENKWACNNAGSAGRDLSAIGMGRSDFYGAGRSTESESIVTIQRALQTAQTPL